MRESTKGGVKALGQRTGDQVQRGGEVWYGGISIELNRKSFNCHILIILMSTHLTKMLNLRNGQSHSQ